VAGPAATRFKQQLLLSSGLLCWTLACSAADQLGMVPTEHGPRLMLYIRQPLGARTAPVYGLRLDQMETAAALPSAGSVVLSDRRAIVDVQIRRYSDVRVEFGRRLTWNVGRQEFGPSGNPPSMAMHLPTPATASAVVARAQLP
jgi:hypothetical protein